LVLFFQKLKLFFSFFFLQLFPFLNKLLKLHLILFKFLLFFFFLFSNIFATCRRCALLLFLLDVVGLGKNVLEAFQIFGIVLDGLQQRVRVAIFVDLCVKRSLIVFVNEGIG
jgi:hypothetical protein